MAKRVRAVKELLYAPKITVASDTGGDVVEMDTHRIGTHAIRWDRTVESPDAHPVLNANEPSEIIFVNDDE